MGKITKKGQGYMEKIGERGNSSCLPRRKRAAATGGEKGKRKWWKGSKKGRSKRKSYNSRSS